MANNLELKVMCSKSELQTICEALLQLPTAVSQRMQQRDTYFIVPNGRLKLREITTAEQTRMMELIFYQRANRSEATWSSYERFPLTVEQAASLRTLLTAALGTLTVVDKIREVAIYRRTRIHLDSIEGLGHFVELETVTGAEADAVAAEELQEVTEALGLMRFLQLPGSYSDLVMAQRGRIG